MRIIYRWYQRKIYPGKEWLKTRLENNKVFLEVLSAIVIALAAVWVAIQANEISDRANQLADRANQLADREIQMSRAENLPKFSLTIAHEAEGSLPKQNIYTLLNHGGFISSVYAHVDHYIEIRIYLNEWFGHKQSISIPDYYDKMCVYRIYFTDTFTKPSSHYDYNTNSLTFISNEVDISEFWLELKNGLQIDDTSIFFNEVVLLEVNYADVYCQTNEQNFHFFNDSSIIEVDMHSYDDMQVISKFLTSSDLDAATIIEEVKADYETFRSSGTINNPVPK